MYVVLGNGRLGEGVTWWGPFEDVGGAERFIEAVGSVLDFFRVELIDPERIGELLGVSPLPAGRS